MGHPQRPTSIIRLAARGLLVVLLVGAAACSGSFSLSPGPLPRASAPMVWSTVLHEASLLDAFPREPASPTIDLAREAVIVGTSRGQVASLSLGDGAVDWTTDVGGGVWVTPLLMYDTVIVVTMDGLLVELDATTGKPLWDEPFQVKGAFASAPAVHQGRIFVQSDRDALYAVDGSTGEQLWTYSREAPYKFTLAGVASPLVTQGMVITGFSDGHLVALQPEDGTVIWDKDFSEGKVKYVDIDSAFATHSSKIIFSAAQAGVVALKPATGEVVWKAPITSAGTPVVAKGKVFVVEDTILHALDVDDGSPEWSYVHKDSLGTPMVDGDTLFLPATHSLMALSAATGAVAYAVPFIYGVQSPPTALGNALYLLANHGTIYRMLVP